MTIKKIILVITLILLRFDEAEVISPFSTFYKLIHKTNLITNKA